MDAGLRKVRRKPVSVASLSSGRPGSVMATNCMPGRGDAAVSTWPRKKRVGGQRLRGGAGLARNHEERAAQVAGVEDLLDRAGVRRVQHEHVREAHLGAEGLVEHLAGEGGAAHAEEDHLRVLEPSDLVREGRGCPRAWLRMMVGEVSQPSRLRTVAASPFHRVASFTQRRSRNSCRLEEAQRLLHRGQLERVRQHQRRVVTSGAAGRGGAGGGGRLLRLAAGFTGASRPAWPRRPSAPPCPRPASAAPCRLRAARPRAGRSWPPAATAGRPPGTGSR